MVPRSSLSRSRNPASMKDTHNQPIMFFVVVTAGLVVALAINHLVYGFGCWGFQPGGKTSGCIYELQILVALLGIGWLAVNLACGKIPPKPIRLLLVGLLAAVSLIMYFATGYTISTSIHYQGPENLLAFFPVAFTSLVVGTYGWRERPPRAIAACENPPANPGRTDQDPHETGNPYQSPRG